MGKGTRCLQLSLKCVQSEGDTHNLDTSPKKFASEKESIPEGCILCYSIYEPFLNDKIIKNRLVFVRG